MMMILTNQAHTQSKFVFGPAGCERSQSHCSPLHEVSTAQSALNPKIKKFGGKSTDFVTI